MPKEYKCCLECGRPKEVKEFYSSHRTDKYPDGKMNSCKACRTLMVDNWEPETYMDILEDADVPYIEKVWNNILERYVDKDPRKINGTTVMGRYLSIMRMVQYRELRWADTERLKLEEEQQKREALKKQGFNEEQIEAELKKNHAPPRPDVCEPPAATATSNSSPIAQSSGDEVLDSLSEEDIQYLTLKWGTGYHGNEWVKMEQLYNDMCSSYDIQTAGHKDTLIMICKASLKANQAIDAGDLESFQKISKVYDSLMKSGKFTAAQNVENEADGIDSVGQLVLFCEKQGFIPRYYKDTPNDKVDRVLQDMQRYTYDLVTEELGLGQMIENAVKAIQTEKERISETTEESDEDSLFQYEKPDQDDESVKEFIKFKNQTNDDDEDED